MANKGMGTGMNGGHQGIGADPDAADETDISSDVQGRNSLQGDDQVNVHNQRQRYPDQPAPRRDEK
jgi:hypothetical protein